MPDSVVLVDFGASRIKAVHWSLARGRTLASRECASPALRRGLHGEAEGDPEHYWQALEATAGLLAQADSSVADLWLCSEMHGFMLASPESSMPLTPYISWQDQRASHRREGNSSRLDDLQKSLAPALMRETGMRLRPGLPIVNLASMVSELCRIGPARLLTLVDWLLVRGGETAPRCHSTIAAGTGLYSIAAATWSENLMRLAGIDMAALSMPTLQANHAAPIGTIKLGGRPIRVWGGLGDLQAAAHGMGFPQLAPALVNLGTGSQVMALTSTLTEGMEIRPCARGELAHAITHIPSGRALNAYASFIDECARAGGGDPVFWRMFSELSADEVLAADPCIDLNIFSAAWRYSGGGSITHISESKFSLHWFMLSLARSWLTQHAEALASIPAKLPGTSFLLGGGLSRRSTFITTVLESLLGRQLLSVPLRTGEETLDGLLKLAETHS